MRRAPLGYRVENGSAMIDEAGAARVRTLFAAYNSGLAMENPIKYIGYTKRENIHFEITKKSTSKLPKPEYEAAKTVDLSTHLNSWISNKQKTIVYFPYASFAHDAKMGMKGFANITTSDKIGTYTGRNMYEKSVELFNAEKRETFEKFRTGEIPVMYATKAFGMGVDVDDVENIYHYAATGNLCDYVQEVGRAARKSSMFEELRKKLIKMA